MELLALIVLVTSIWVGFDANAIGARKGLMKGLADMGPVGWFFAMLLLWIVAFPLYLANRARIREAAARSKARRGRPLTGR